MPLSRIVCDGGKRPSCPCSYVPLKLLKYERNLLLHQQPRKLSAGSAGRLPDLFPSVNGAARPIPDRNGKPADQPHDELHSSTTAWLRRAMDGIQQMHESEDVRREVAKRLF